MRRDEGRGRRKGIRGGRIKIPCLSSYYLEVAKTGAKRNKLILYSWAWTQNVWAPN